MSQEPNLLKHEVLHMSFFLHKCVEEELLEHEEIMKNPEWKEQAETASKALFDLYQKIGASHG